MNFNIDDVLKVAQIVVTIACAALSLWLYLRSADRATVDAMRSDQRAGDAELASRIGALGSEIRSSLARDSDFHTRLSILETRMQHVPTHADLQGIRQEMRELNESVSAINERSETTQEMVQRIQGFLMDRGQR